MKSVRRAPRYADAALPNAARFLALVEIEKKILEAGEILDAGPFHPRDGGAPDTLARLRVSLVRTRETIAREAAAVLPAARREMDEAIGAPEPAAEERLAPE